MDSQRFCSLQRHTAQISALSSSTLSMQHHHPTQFTHRWTKHRRSTWTQAYKLKSSNGAEVLVDQVSICRTDSKPDCSGSADPLGQAPLLGWQDGRRRLMHAFKMTKNALSNFTMGR